MQPFPEKRSGTGVLFRGLETESDLGFTIKSWVRSYAKSPWAGTLSRDHQVKAIRETILDLLQRPTTQLVMAVNEHDRTLLYGFCCFETDWGHPLLHYVYVKAGFRNCGIGGDLRDISLALYPDVKPAFTFRTNSCRRFLRSARYVPDLVRRNRKPEGNHEDQSSPPAR